MPKNAAYGFLLVLVFSCGQSVRADTPECLSSHLKGQGQLTEMPQAKVPIPIVVDINVISIEEIEDAKETFILDFYLHIDWEDKRLATAAGNREQTCELAPGMVWQADKRIWNPEIEFINFLKEPKKITEVITLRGDGNCRYSARIKGSFNSSFDLRSFPFDRQVLVMSLESFSYNQTKLGFKPGPITINSTELAGWHVESVSAQEEKHKYPDEADPYSRCNLSIRVKRASGFYFWKLYIPMMLIVVLSWSVFWISRKEFETQMNLSVTGVLSLVAFNFVTSEDLPKISYLTLLDLTILISYVSIFTCAIGSILLHVLDQKGKEQLANHISQYCRWLFPIVYLGVHLVGLLA